jgi:hypothetical protein
VDGIWKGITGKASDFKEKVTNFFKNIISSVKSKQVLDEQSPSKVFAKIGENMVLGLDVGFTRKMANVGRNIAGMTASLAGPQLAGAAVSNQVNSSAENYTFYAPVTIGGGTGVSLGEAIKLRRY